MLAPSGTAEGVRGDMRRRVSLASHVHRDHILLEARIGESGRGVGVPDFCAHTAAGQTATPQFKKKKRLAAFTVFGSFSVSTAR